MTQNVRVPPFDEAPSTVIGSTPTTEIPFSFPFWSADDIIVLIDGEQLSSSAYTVEGLAVQDGEAVVGGYGSGTVTLDAAVSNVTVTIDRLVVGDRETQFSTSSPLGMRPLNADLNRLTARQQDLKRLVDTNRAYLDDAIEEAGSAIGLIGKADKAQNGADFADLVEVGENIEIKPSATATAKPLATIINDWSNSVKSYGALGDNSTDDTAAFVAAMAEHPGKPIFAPPPTGAYRLGAVGGLGAAGSGLIGVSGYNTLIRAKSGFTGAIFYNPNAGTGGSAYGLFRDLRFDGNTQDVTFIDLSHCDTYVVERVNGVGGTSKATAIGRLVKFGAPTDSSSYNNVVRDCAASYFAKAVEFGLNANQNRVEGGTFTLNDIAFDCAPGGVLLRPQLLGVRVEGNNVGVKEGAQHGAYLGYFEDNTNGDFSFTTDSDGCVILPGTTTASTATPLTNRANATNLRCLSDDLGVYDYQSSLSRVRYQTGRTIKAGSGVDPTALAVPAGAAAVLSDVWATPPALGNGVALEGINGAGTNTVVILSVDSSNRVTVAGYDRASATYTRLFLGENWSVNGTGFDYAGVKVIGARDTGWTAMTGSGSKGALAAAAAGTASGAYVQSELQGALNRIAALEARMKSYDDALFTHGLIGS